MAKELELVEEVDVLEINEIESDDNFWCCIIGGGKETD